MVVRWERGEGMTEIGEGTQKYNLVVAEQSWGFNIQHRQYSQ